jgi:hypothetical protein
MLTLLRERSLLLQGDGWEGCLTLCRCGTVCPIVPLWQRKPGQSAANERSRLSLPRPMALSRSGFVGCPRCNFSTPGRAARRLQSLDPSPWGSGDSKHLDQERNQPPDPYISGCPPWGHGLSGSILLSKRYRSSHGLLEQKVCPTAAVHSLSLHHVYRVTPSFGMRQG